MQKHQMQKRRENFVVNELGNVFYGEKTQSTFSI